MPDYQFAISLFHPLVREVAAACCAEQASQVIPGGRLKRVRIGSSHLQGYIIPACGLASDEVTVVIEVDTLEVEILWGRSGDDSFYQGGRPVHVP